MQEKIFIKGIGWRFSPLPPKCSVPDGELSSGTGTSGISEDRDEAIVSLAFGAVRRCLQDAETEMKEVDAVVTASVDLWDGKTASNIAVTEVAGAVMKAETRIAGDGLLAIFHAAMTILAGQYQKVLVVAHGKASEGEQESLSNWAFDPVWQQTLGLTEFQALGLQAQAFLRRCPSAIGSEELRAKIVAALSGRTCSEEDVLLSPVEFFPLHRLEIPTSGDGACAVLLEAGNSGNRKSAGKNGKSVAVRLEGFGYDLEAHYLGDRNLAQSAALRRAVARACAMVERGQDAHAILKKIRRCHWSLRSSVQLPLWAESAGVWNFEDGLEALSEKVNLYQNEKGNLALSNDNLQSSDLQRRIWDGVPPFVGGLLRLICAVEELRDSSSQNRHLVHGIHGAAGQLQAVCLLAGEGGG